MLPTDIENGLFSKGPENAKGFRVPVAAAVEGTTSDGRRFKETTEVSFISHVGAIIDLRNPAGLGTRVKMAIPLPPALSEGRDLRLVIKGEVIDAGHDPAPGERMKVAIRFESRYVVESAEA